jgi:hypothetical protein
MKSNILLEVVVDKVVVRSGFQNLEYNILNKFRLQSFSGYIVYLSARFCMSNKSFGDRL